MLYSWTIAHLTEHIKLLFWEKFVCIDFNKWNGIEWGITDFKKELGMRKKKWIKIQTSRKMWKTD